MRLLASLAVAGVVVSLAGVLDAALAQGAPFGVPRPQTPPAAPDAGGIAGWIMAKQAEFYRSFTGLIRAAKTDGSALWALLGVSFLYGIFHAAGPGHGKAVISSYLVANDETWRRGIALSFASAMLQATVAVAIVGVGAVLLGATSRAMCRTADAVEVASYALIAAVGAWLIWVKGRELVRAMAAMRPRPTTVGAAATGHAHDHHHGHHHHHHHDHDHHGHSHGPEPHELAGPGGWRRGLAAIIAVGLRPCSGAIIVLVFAFAQGLFWAGVASAFVMGLGTAITVAAIATLAVSARAVATRIAETRSGTGSLALRGIEFVAAVVVLMFGLLLLAGYMATERIAFC